MFHSSNTHVSLDALRTQSAQKAIVFTRPWPYQDAAFLNRFLADARAGVLYVTLARQHSQERSWLASLVHQLAEEAAEIGTALYPLLAQGDAEALGAGLAAALSAFNAQSVLYLDTASFTPDSDFARFLRGFAQAPQRTAQIVLSSRLLTQPALIRLFDYGMAAILSPVRRRNEVQFEPGVTDALQLEIRAFGNGRVALNGHPVTNWDGVLPRTLFYYLIDHPYVTRDAIFADVWPNTSLKDATDIFHVTKHKVAEVLSRQAPAGADCELTEYKQGLYVPNEGLIRHYDVALFEEAAERATISTDERELEILCQRAIELYTGPYLQDIDAAWVVRRRAELALQYSDVLVWLARIVERRGESERALNLYTKAVAERPEREDLRRSVIRLLLNLKRYDAAREQYALLDEQVFRRQGLKPSQDTLDLLRELEGRDS